MAKVVKVEAVKVTELQEVISYYLDGITEAIRMGGDVRDNIIGQCEDCKRKINEWNALNIIPAEKEKVPTDEKHNYLKTAEYALNKDPDEVTLHERKCILQAKCYAFLKRTMREKNDIPGPEATEQDIFAYVDVMLFEMPLFREYEKQYYHSMMQVIEDVVKEVINERKANQQLEFFN